MPDARVEKMFDVSLTLHADHEYNASTFAARVTAATLSDLHSAITSAIGALKGPLHGGANEEVMKMLLSIGSLDNAEATVRDYFAHKRKVPGFGHRVYKTMDPRATILKEFSRELGARERKAKWYEMSTRIHDLVVREKSLYPNVDFYSASLYYVMRIPIDLYTPIFAVSRVVGWCAHVLEQYANNRLIRPMSDYVGPTDQAVRADRSADGGESGLTRRGPTTRVPKNLGFDGLYVGNRLRHAGAEGARCLDGASGRIVAMARRAYGVIPTKRAGVSEQDPRVWIAAAKATIREVAAKAGARAKRIVEIAVSGQQHGLVALDAAGRVLRPAKLWNDVSTAREAREIVERVGGAAAMRAATGTPSPGFTASKVLWFSRAHPDLWDRCATVCLPHDYLNLWLSGERAAEAGDASGTGYFDVRARRYAKKVMDAIDPDLAARVPPLRGRGPRSARCRPRARKSWDCRAVSSSAPAAATT